MISAGATPVEVPAQAAAVYGANLDLARRYVDMLSTTGVERGLIGPREPARLWDRHLFNSSALAGAIPLDVTVADIGSGAGLPGIPLALCRADLRVFLVEPMLRRAEFLREVSASLGIDATVVHGRAEDQPRGWVDVVVARAVAPLDRLIPLGLPLLRAPGTLLALKGQGAAAEVANAGKVLAKWPAAQVSVGTVAFHTARAHVVRIDL